MCWIGFKVISFLFMLLVAKNNQSLDDAGLRGKRHCCGVLNLEMENIVLHALRPDHHTAAFSGNMHGLAWSSYNWSITGLHLLCLSRVLNDLSSKKNSWMGGFENLLLKFIIRGVVQHETVKSSRSLKNPLKLCYFLHPKL